jgi:SAM-dependent methyltransferase
VIRRVARSVRRAVGWPAPPDYRALLFEELRAYLADRRPARILEIGPKDGLDTRRLLTLEPKQLTLIDLPRAEAANRRWLAGITSPAVEYISANLMYSEVVGTLSPYDLVWCTGVLYHNPEQLRMIRLLYDLLLPGGVLVLESATTRNPRLRAANCVEIVYPPSDELKRRYHISANITHLPSARALAAWMEMVGFERITASTCHRRVSRALARARAALIGTRPVTPRSTVYYALGEADGYEIGRAR